MSREDYCYCYYCASKFLKETAPDLPPLLPTYLVCYSNLPTYTYLYCTTTLFTTTNIDKRSNKDNSNYCLEMPLSLYYGCNHRYIGSVDLL